VRLLGGQVVIGSPSGGGVVVEARFGTARAASVREKLPPDPGIRAG
jgi:hypothetical protein